MISHTEYFTKGKKEMLKRKKESPDIKISQDDISQKLVVILLVAVPENGYKLDKYFGVPNGRGMNQTQRVCRGKESQGAVSSFENIYNLDDYLNMTRNGREAPAFLPTTDKGRSVESCICDAELHLTPLELLQEDEIITLSIRIEQNTQPKMDLKLTLTGVEEGSNQAIFAGRLCNHYDLKILTNLESFQDEKKERTILPLSPADSPKSLRRCCEGLAEGPDPNRVAAAYSFILQKAYKEYTGLKVSGASALLQLPGSDITINIPEGIHGILVAHAHTDFQPFREFVPESECFIAPVAEVQYIPRDQNQKEKKFLIRIPHNVEDKDSWANIQVRRVDIYKNAPAALVPPTDYTVDENFINLRTKTFAQFVCSVPGCLEVCTGTAQAFLFGNSNSFRLYVCGPLYNLEAFIRALKAKESGTKAKRELLEQADMRWVPGDMDEKQFIKVLFSSPKWDPKLRSDQRWDENSKTVMQIVPMGNLPSLSRCHTCRMNPTCIAEFDFLPPEGSSFSPFTGKLEVVPQGEREKPILEIFVN